jgi:2-C-methyl-D-erythritol 4-phosphate cytidylyltransferase
MRVVAIIPCAGEGKRFGAQKQYVSLGGRPLFVHAISTFEGSIVDRIIVVVREEDIEHTKQILHQYRFSKVEGIFPGGKKRQDSVYIGLKRIGDPPEIVVVHDGARPFVTKNLIRRVVDGAMEYGAATAALPITDTIKFSKDSNFVEKTIPRDGMWAVQTPQAFRYDLLKRAFEKAEIDGFYGSDEAMLVERLPYKVRIIMGESENIKITREGDLSLAESILSTRAQNACGHRI